MFHINQQVFDELHQSAEEFPPLKHALLVNAKRNPAVIDLRPLFSWLLSRLIREKEWRIKAEERLTEYKKKLREAEDKLEECRRAKPGS